MCSRSVFPSCSERSTMAPDQLVPQAPMQSDDAVCDLSRFEQQMMMHRRNDGMVRGGLFETPQGCWHAVRL